MPSTGKEQARDSTIYNKLLQNYITVHQKLPDNKLLTNNFALLKDYIDYFRRENVTIVFYKLPVHCKIEQTPYNKALENASEKAFPQNIFKWLPESNCNDFIYNDGEHLSYQSALKFAKGKFDF